MVRRILSALVVGLFLENTPAYSQRIDKVHFTLAGNLSVPSTQLKEAVDNNFAGFGAGFGTSMMFNTTARTKNTPVMVGIDLNYITFGRDKIRGSDVTPPYKTSFNFYSACGAMRVLPFPDRIGISPFIEGMLGAKIMNARTKIDKDFFSTINKDQDEVLNNTTDAGLGYALGVGFFNRRFKEDQDGTLVAKESFTLRVVYHWGVTADYVERGSVRVENGTVMFSKGETRLDMLLIQLGLYVF